MAKLSEVPSGTIERRQDYECPKALLLTQPWNLFLGEYDPVLPMPVYVRCRASYKSTVKMLAVQGMGNKAGLVSQETLAGI